MQQTSLQLYICHPGGESYFCMCTDTQLQTRHQSRLQRSRCFKKSASLHLQERPMLSSRERSRKTFPSQCAFSNLLMDQPSTLWHNPSEVRSYCTAKKDPGHPNSKQNFHSAGAWGLINYLFVPGQIAQKQDLNCL